MGRLIVIEGTDCSGKETQSKKLEEYLKSQNEKVERLSFPMYDTPSGKIIGGPFLGKSYISESFFDEPSKVDPRVSSLYYAADRLYNLPKLQALLDEDYTVILDRYVMSNMAHQGGKELDPTKRKEIFSFIEELEFNMLHLPRPDGIIFLYMPFDKIKILRAKRDEALDRVEEDDTYLINSEKTYLELASIYNYNIINCTDENDEIRSIDDISKDVIETYQRIRKN